MYSTLLLTVLLIIGFFFFIRGSVKDRTEVMTFMVFDTEEKVFPYLKEYFGQKAYQVKSIDGSKNQVTFAGIVSPSVFLAIFLSFLAASALFSIGLVLSFIYPSTHNLFLLLTLLAPFAGIFYWQGANRLEEVCLKLESNLVDSQEEKQAKSIFKIRAHRDELIELQKSLPFQFSIL